jgi:hypothetical protein
LYRKGVLIVGAQAGDCADAVNPINKRKNNIQFFIATL